MKTNNSITQKYIEEYMAAAQSGSYQIPINADVSGSMTIFSDDGLVVMDENGMTGYSRGTMQWKLEAEKICMRGTYVFCDNAEDAARVCSWCGSRGGESKYHPGTCANCGGNL